jgi:hypothetical protein
MGRFVGYEPCPKCTRMGRDSRGDNLGRYADGGGHCFSCQYHEFPKHYVPRIDKPNVTKSVADGSKAVLPIDFTREVPARALTWLLQYGLPWSYWEPLTGYSPKEERLVFLVGTPTKFSIGRWIGTTTDKATAPRKWYVWGDSHKHVEVLRASNGNGDGGVVCLVEDIVSAHKVANAGICSIPLFGTKIFDDVLYYLLQTNQEVCLWLDKDQESQVRKQALRLESIINKPVKVIITEKDPKELNFEDIQTNCRIN